jgi:hypothetical protein
MYDAALPVRTDDDSTSFRATMAEQLRHAPWLFVSAIAHAIVLLLVLFLMPREAVTRTQNAVTVAPEAEPPALLPPPVVPPPVVQPDQALLPDTVDTPLQADDTVPDPAGDDAAEPADPVASHVVGLLPTSRSGPRGLPGLPGGRGRGAKGSFQDAIDPALEWLARHQDEDGRWDCDGFMKHDTEGEPCDGPGNPVHDVGVTGLALLAFLGDGSTLREGRYRSQVRAAAMWLRAQQEENGRFGPASASDFVYDHAIAAYAMCEAHGLSGYETLRSTAQRGLDYLQTHRNPYAAWRYQPRDGDNDASVTGWCILAMCSGEHFGLVVDRNALRIAMTWLESCTSPGGHVGYQRAGQLGARKPGTHGERFPADRTDPLTAAVLLCRAFLGQDPRDQPAMRAAGQRLHARLPRWDPKAGTIDFYYWYYGTYAMHQLGGPAWRDWSQAISRAVVATQRPAGNARGSWDPIDVWGEDGGRVYGTAILALTLQAHHRYGRLIPGSR